METLLSPSDILLYGRQLVDLRFYFHEPTGDAETPARSGANRFLQRQLDRRETGDVPLFARIYGFSFEGHYYDLDKPTVYLVHGEGIVAETLPADFDPGSRWSRAPESPDRTGVASQQGSFSRGIRVWSYDKADLSIRLDIESGTFEEILLEAELMSESTRAHYSGAKVSGAKVSGGKVSGGKVSGGKVSGAKVGGRSGRED